MGHVLTDKGRTVYTSLPAQHYNTEAVAPLYQEHWGSKSAYGI